MDAFLLLNSRLTFTQVLYSCNSWAVIPALLLLTSSKSPTVTAGTLDAVVWAGLKSC